MNNKNGGPMVLIVEDDGVGALLLEGALSRRGIAVTLAGDGVHALEEIFRHAPHLIITDLRMPGMDGLNLIRAVRRRRELDTVSIVAVSAITEGAVREEALSLGADEFFPKPYDPETLVNDILPFLPLPAENPGQGTA